MCPQPETNGHRFADMAADPTVVGEMLRNADTIQSLKIYLAGAVQTVVVKALLAALDIVLKPDATGTRDIGAFDKRFRRILLNYADIAWDYFPLADFTHFSEVAVDSGSTVRQMRVGKVLSGATAASYGIAYCSPLGGLADSPVLDFDKKMILEAFVYPTANADVTGRLSVRLMSEIDLGADISFKGFGFRMTYNSIVFPQYTVQGVWHDGANPYTVGGSKYTLNTRCRLRAEYRLTTGQIDFYINDTLIGSAAANLPTGVSGSYPILQIAAHNGATAAACTLHCQQLRVGLEL